MTASAASQTGLDEAQRSQSRRPDHPGFKVQRELITDSYPPLPRSSF
jgi:hypothetical protein